METLIDVQKIWEFLPHRYPFLLVDKVIKSDNGKTLTAVKNVTINEPFFQGHFPQKPVFPGVLIIEALAQATGLLAFTAKDGAPVGHIFYLVGVDNARFKQQVVPGDQLILEIVFVKAARGIWKFEAKALVDDKIVATVDLMCAVRES